MDAMQGLTDGAARRVLIVDDEAFGRMNLRHALADHPAWQVAGEFDGARTARHFLAQHDADLVFLDIRMPEEDGLSLARDLCRLPAPPLVVFVTAFDVHAIEAFEAHALDYLLKPLDDDRLAAALARADAMLAQRQRAAHAHALQQYFAAQDRSGATPPFWSQIGVRSVGAIERILLEQVLWIASAGNYVELHLRERTVLHRMPIGRLEAHLDPRDFVRIHRRFIVRAGQCVALSGTPDSGHALALQCGATLSVSEPFLQRLRDLMRTR